MITAKEAKSKMETKRELTKDKFVESHVEFLAKLEKTILEKCECGNGYLKIVVRDQDDFSEKDFKYLMDFMKDLGYLTREGDEKDAYRTFEIWWYQ